MIDKFWDLKMIKEPKDIFKLDYKKISLLEGWGDLSILNLKNAILSSKKIGLDKFIYSVGIRHIGQKMQKFLPVFFSIQEFSKLFEEKKTTNIKKPV